MHLLFWAQNLGMGGSDSGGPTGRIMSSIAGHGGLAGPGGIAGPHGGIAG